MVQSAEWQGSGHTQLLESGSSQGWMFLLNLDLPA